MTYPPPPAPDAGAGTVSVTVSIPDTTAYRALIYGHLLELANIKSFDDSAAGGNAALEFESAIEGITYA